MNCVLEVLAHSPELCLALDVEPHHENCPVAKRKARLQQSSPSPDNASSGGTGPAQPIVNRAVRKSKRSSSGKRSPSLIGEATAAAGGNRSRSASEASDTSTNAAANNETTFCALCEVESLLGHIHNPNPNGAVAPSDFVSGFMDHVAPWFKLGQQEDSHEFLRLLIDAMQRSCTTARKSTTVEGPTKSAEDSAKEDVEYPFKLFRGTVESNVICEACNASSSKIDPIEDIGLECFQQDAIRPRAAATGKMLANVQDAFKRFARAEPLDAYKCETCGKLGRATKQSRLASIPPILTLHLKRFRYGADAASHASAARSGRSEVSQLANMWPQQTELLAFGKSGSAKIEGHVQFDQILDLRPFLTPELQERHKQKLITRLFAVIVHAGKNSHSGHYVAYVRNMQKNEWWKMDDARVTKASVLEVQNAEAYMLFYRVVDHPIALQLRQANKQLEDQRLLQEEQQKKLAEEALKPESAPTPAISNRKRKRAPPDYETVEQWTRAKIRSPRSVVTILKRAEEFISDQVDFEPDFFKLISDEASKSGAEVGGGPSGVCGKFQ